MRGDLERVRALLDAGVEPNACSPDLVTPIAYAAGNGHAQVVQLLLERGARQLYDEEQGELVMNKAVRNRDEAVADLLRARKAASPPWLRVHCPE